MRHASFEKFIIVSTLALGGLLLLSPDASASGVEIQSVKMLALQSVNSMVESGSLLKGCACAAGFIFIGLKLIGPNSKTL